MYCHFVVLMHHAHGIKYNAQKKTFLGEEEGAEDCRQVVAPQLRRGAGASFGLNLLGNSRFYADIKNLNMPHDPDIQSMRYQSLKPRLQKGMGLLRGTAAEPAG